MDALFNRWKPLISLMQLLLATGALDVASVTLNNGYKMPVIAAGTGGFDNASAAVAVANALQTPGLAHIHSAFDYFNLRGVAKGLQESGRPRYDVFVTSMTSPCVHAAPPARNVTDLDECYNLTWRELHATLDALQLDHVDLMLLHGPSEPFGYTGGCSRETCALNQAQWRAYQVESQQHVTQRLLTRLLPTRTSTSQARRGPLV